LPFLKTRSAGETLAAEGESSKARMIVARIAVKAFIMFGQPSQRQVFQSVSFISLAHNKLVAFGVG
jgi:hypothetical protein